MFLSLTRVLVGVVLAATAVFAQMSSQLAANGTMPDPSSTNNRVLVSGRVVAEDGSVLPADLAIERVCGDLVTVEGYPDSRGEFQFQEVANSSRDIASGTAQPTGNDGRMFPVDWNGCDLRARAVGYSSSSFSFAGKVEGFSQVNAGALFIHRLAANNSISGQSISALDLAAPEKAKKDFSKGEDSIRKADWKEAQRCFHKALDRHPRFAAAWAELARAQQQLGDSDSAQQSFHKALELDPRMLVAYAGLSEIAVQNRRWKDLEDSTSHILAINSDAYPQFWFLNAVAKYNLGLVDPAETSVLRGMRLDTQHRFPKMEHLFGMILGVKRQYAEAADHLKNYLRLDPKAPDASAVAAQLDRFQQLAGPTVAGK